MISREGGATGYDLAVNLVEDDAHGARHLRARAHGAEDGLHLRRVLDPLAQHLGGPVVRRVDLDRAIACVRGGHVRQRRLAEARGSRDEQQWLLGPLAGRRSAGRAAR